MKARCLGQSQEQEREEKLTSAAWKSTVTGTCSWTQGLPSNRGVWEGHMFVTPRHGASRQQRGPVLQTQVKQLPGAGLLPGFGQREGRMLKSCFRHPGVLNKAQTSQEPGLKAQCCKSYIGV